MKNVLFISLACLALAAGAQTAPPRKPPVKAPANKAPAKATAAAPAAAAPVKLSDAELEIAGKIHTGDISCELGSSVKVAQHDRPGFFKVSLKGHNFVMHPVESRTGAIRLEDNVNGAVWLQLANKSMLMSQKLGQRLADECQSAEQVRVAEELKAKPAPDLLEQQPAQK